MTIKKVLTNSKKSLSPTSKTPHLDSEVLLSYALGKPREWILAHPEREITKNQEKKFLGLVKKRKAGEPVAYLTGHKEFYGLDFVVDKRVPIPRPETEMLVEEIIHCTRDAGVPPAYCIVDVGTGSGCIAITLAKHLSHVKIIATDISQDVLQVAKKNAKKHQVDKQITFIKGNLLESCLKNIKQFPSPIIVANLPYLPQKIYDSTDKSVQQEPAQAHLGGKKGSELIEKFLKQAVQLKPSVIFLEFHYQYKNELEKIAAKYFTHQKIKFKKDLQGKTRFLIIK